MAVQGVGQKTWFVVIERGDGRHDLLQCPY